MLHICIVRVPARSEPSVFRRLRDGFILLLTAMSPVPTLSQRRRHISISMKNIGISTNIGIFCQRRQETRKKTLSRRTLEPHRFYMSGKRAIFAPPKKPIKI